MWAFGGCVQLQKLLHRNFIRRQIKWARDSAHWNTGTLLCPTQFPHGPKGWQESLSRQPAWVGTCTVHSGWVGEPCYGHRNTYPSRPPNSQELVSWKGLRANGFPEVPAAATTAMVSINIKSCKFFLWSYKLGIGCFGFGFGHVQNET